MRRIELYLWTFEPFVINDAWTVVDANNKYWQWSVTETDCTAPPTLSACQVWIAEQGEPAFDYDPDLADICPPSEIYCASQGWPCDREDPAYIERKRTCYDPPYWIQNPNQGQNLKRARSVSFPSWNSLLPPANVCDGYVFIRVCQSFCSHGGRAWPGGMHGRGGGMHAHDKPRVCCQDWWLIRSTFTVIGPYLIYFLNRMNNDLPMKYRSGKVNSNTVNSKFHLIRSYCEILAKILSFHV